MRKLIMWNVMTLDGYFEGKQPWDLSFHAAVWGKELEKISLEQLQSADYLVFGRKTYEGMASYWTNPEAATAEPEVAQWMNRIPKLVFSKTLKSAEWNNTTIIRENTAHEIRKIKEQEGKDIYVFGSADLSETFINENLFDEYRICIAPVLLGGGRPLFTPGVNSKELSLVSTQQLSTGGVILKYSK